MVRSAKEGSRDGGFYFTSAQGPKRKEKDPSENTFELIWTADLFLQNTGSLLQNGQELTSLGWD